jgi:hypothetical protein
MPAPKSITLLRRTAVALAAVLGLISNTDVSAAKVTLNNASGNTCDYSGSIQINPDASLSINCSGTTTTPPPPPPPPVTGAPGTFTVSAPSSGALNAVVAVTITRTGGVTGAFAIGFSMSGAGCATQLSAAASIPDGQAATSFPIALAGASGTCSIQLVGLAQIDTTTVSGSASIGSPSVASISVGTPSTGGGGGGGSLVNCPTGYAQPSDMLTASLGGWGNPLLQMQRSSQIVSIPLPAQPATKSSGVVQFSESAGGAYTPQGSTLEVSINKCPGLIEAPSTTNYCNVSTGNPNYVNVTWLTKAYGPATSSATAAVYGLCWAGDAGAQYYINARWSYSVCAFSQPICGFAIQQNEGPY